MTSPLNPDMYIKIPTGYSLLGTHRQTQDQTHPPASTACSLLLFYAAFQNLGVVISTFLSLITQCTPNFPQVHLFLSIPIATYLMPTP